MALDEDQYIINENSERVVPDSTVRKTFFANCLEFPTFLALIALMLTGTAIGNIFLYRTCVHSLEYSKSECNIFLVPDKSGTNDTLEQEVQKYTAFVNTVKTVIESLAPAALSLFLGVWSNTYGRKPLIVWPLLGLAISCMLMVVYAMLDDLGPWWFIITTIPMSITGGVTAMLTGSYCYINDVTTAEARTLRMAIFGASVSAGSIIGLLLSSDLVKAVGNVYLLLIVSAILVAAYVFSNIVLEESLIGAIEGSVLTVFDISHVRDMANECFKRRPQYGRAQILLLGLCNGLLLLVVYGLSNIDYGYTREKLHWSLKNYTRYSALNTFVSFTGAFVIIGLFQKLLRFSDLLLAIFALFFGIAEYIIKAFAVSSWNMYLAAVIAIPKGMASFLIRSLLTKILAADVVAKVFTLMAALDALCPLLAPIMYSSLYAFTISTFPGAVYILSSGIVFICSIMLGFVQYYRWNLASPYQSLITDETLSED